MNSRKIIVQILNDVFYKGKYSNIELDYCLNKANLNNKDRALVTEVVYGTIRYKLKIDYILRQFIKDMKKVEPEILNILRSAVYQILFLSKIPGYAAVNESVNMAKSVSKYSSGFVNGVLRNILRNKDKDFMKNIKKNEKLQVEYSFPKWMVDIFIKQYGIQNTKVILSGLNSVPNVTVRVNQIKSSYDEIYNSLISSNYDIEEGTICPESIQIIKGSSIEQNDLFKKGYITVQDESAMLAGAILEAEEQMNVIDLCSAPGGKTTHISEIMNNTGEIIACDIYEHKLSLIKDNCERLGIINVKTMLQDATVLNKDFINFADRVLLDVPCSGLGIIKKKPEIKWNKTKKDLTELCDIQRKIMNNAWEYLKTGGKMVYSTCTLNKEENEKNVDWFINNHSDAEIEKIYVGSLDNIVYNDNNTITILPTDKMDGFFLAKIKKTR